MKSKSWKGQEARVIETIAGLILKGRQNEAMLLREQNAIELTPQFVRLVSSRVCGLRIASQHIGGTRLALIYCKGRLQKFLRDRHVATSDWPFSDVRRHLVEARRGLAPAGAEVIDDTIVGMWTQLQRIGATDAVGRPLKGVEALRAAYITDAITDADRLPWPRHATSSRQRASQALLEKRSREGWPEIGAHEDVPETNRALHVALSQYATSSKLVHKGVPLAEILRPEHSMRDTEEKKIDRSAVRPGGIRLIAAHASNSGTRREHEPIIAGLSRDKTWGGWRTEHEVHEGIAALYAETPWMSELLTWIMHSATASLRETPSRLRIPPVLLVGPPGCGKTHLATRLAEIAGLPARRIDMSSMQSGFALVGSEAAWSNSRPGEPVSMLAEQDVANPVLLLDELEKCAANKSASDPLQSLLPLLQRETAVNFRCPSLQREIDLSHLNFIMCANGITERIPRPFLDRVTVFHVGYPDEDHLRNFIERRFASLAADEEVIETIIGNMADGRLTLRGLSRLEESFVRKRDAPLLH